MCDNRQNKIFRCVCCSLYHQINQHLQACRKKHTKRKNRGCTDSNQTWPFLPKPGCRPDDVAHVRRNHRLPAKAASSNGVIIVRDNAESCTFPFASTSLSTTTSPHQIPPSTIPLLPRNTVSGATLPSAAHSDHCTAGSERQGGVVTL